MIPDRVALALIDAAKANEIEPAALMALVDIETGGRLFEADGRTPMLLYERHVAYREAAKYGVQAQFVRAGLAIPRWDRATQYSDQRTSQQRLDLLARAKAIHEEVACRSCSWGLGQTLGSLAESIGFDSARAMVAHMTGSLAGQIDCMIREIKRSHLIEPLNAHDWAHVARVYNGPGYAANQYDSRLANAHARALRRLQILCPAGVPRELPPEDRLTPDEIRAIQERLRELGYAEVGLVDGVWGSRTMGALAAFQAHEGLPVSGHYDAATRDALTTAAPRPINPERRKATPGDLKDAGSRTIPAAEKLSIVGRLLKWLGLGGAAAAGTDQAGWLDGLKDQLSELREVMTTLSDLWSAIAPYWWVAAIVAGLALAYWAEQIIAARLADHRTGLHAGP
jgi:hypothetical protein